MRFSGPPRTPSLSLSMDQNCVILSLEYSYLINSLVALFESDSGLWQCHDVSHTLIPHSEVQGPQTRIIDNLARLKSTVLMLNNNGMAETNHIKLVEPQRANPLITISINGNETFVNNSRTEILKAYQHVNYKRIVLSAAELSMVGPNFATRLDAIAKRCNVEIIMNREETDFRTPPKATNITSVYILGSTDNSCLAETETKILIDTLLRGCYVDRITMPLSLIPILGGPGLANFSEITRQLNVTIYLPYLMPLIFYSEVLQSNDDLSLWITSPSIAEIKLTKENINNLLTEVDPRKSSRATLYTQKAEMLKNKLDLIGAYRQGDVLNLMLKHGVYVQLPSFGEPANNTIVVQGNNRDSVSNAVVDLCQLSSDFHDLSFGFHKKLMAAELEYYFINLISNSKTCILTYNQNGMNIMGGQSDVRALLASFVTNSSEAAFLTSILKRMDSGMQLQFKMELDNAQKDFLSGKKKGKILKILSQLNHIPTIKFERLNAHNFTIKIEINVDPSHKGNNLLSSLDTLQRAVKLVELEWPAEMQFNIPEVFHKSIIGNGGSIIQSIMKRYNVFIKFSSSSYNQRKGEDEKSSGKILYLFKRKDNVLIKCPMKNLKNILFVKHEIDYFVAQCCQNKCPQLNGISAVYHNVDVKLLKSHYSMLIKKMQFNLEFVTNLEAEYDTFISFPTSLLQFEENSSYVVSIKGDHANTRKCAQQLTNLFPASYEFQLTYCPGKFEELLSNQSAEFRQKIAIPLNMLLDIEIVSSTQLQAHAPAFHQVIVSSYDSTNLEKAVTIMTHYLRRKQFLIMNKQELIMNFISETEGPSIAKGPVKKGSSREEKRPLKSITNHPAATKKKGSANVYSSPQNWAIKR